MHARSSDRGRALAFAAPLVLVLSLWNNVVVPRLPGCYVATNVAATAGLLAAARGSRLSWADMGLARARLGSGLGWGVAAAAPVACGYAVALCVPGLRPMLADARVAGLDRRAIAHHVLVRIPLGTVLWEEAAFRGVLPAALARVVPVRAATVGSAVVFGIWHVRPTLEALTANDLLGGGAPRALAVSGSCLATGGAGLLFARLRLGSGSLLAPVLVHLATNSLGTLAATAAHRSQCGDDGSARRQRPCRGGRARAPSGPHLHRRQECP